MIEDVRSLTTLTRLLVLLRRRSVVVGHLILSSSDFGSITTSLVHDSIDLVSDSLVSISLLDGSSNISSSIGGSGDGGKNRLCIGSSELRSSSFAFGNNSLSIDSNTGDIHDGSGICNGSSIVLGFGLSLGLSLKSDCRHGQNGGKSKGPHVCLGSNILKNLFRYRFL